MAIEMKSISNYDYLRYTTTASREISDEPNIPISVISESMGHDNETTTQIYLASLDTSVIDQANAKILKKL
jgi:integrase